MSVSALTAEPFGGAMYLDHLSDEFGGQCHRSKTVVARLKNMILGVPDGGPDARCTQP